jgi:hypothetical protein
LFREKGVEASKQFFWLFLSEKMAALWDDAAGDVFCELSETRESKPARLYSPPNAKE